MVKLLGPGDADMRRWPGSSLDQIMDFRLFGAKPLSEPMMTNRQLDAEEHISINLYLKTKIFIQENARENAVWKLVVILPQSQCINYLSTKLRASTFVKADILTHRRPGRYFDNYKDNFSSGFYPLSEYCTFPSIDSSRLYYSRTNIVHSGSSIFVFYGY